ncbi:MAG: hypothetical protein M4579_001915 [Chaenotheca gracillima]|nr:MAG: hypothetical protein M4579_001915 [Chaenotheca gracillima]
MSFMSQFGTPPRSPTANSSPTAPPDISPSSSQLFSGPSKDSPPPPRSRVERPSSRPMSMLQTYHPPLMDIAQDTLPELQPIFTFLNSHSNKLYQEGYLLKLNDLDSQGKPASDRNWTECFAQLVGTVLSVWDASALDQAGQDGEVIPYFINLTDASIKMIETLPTRAKDVQPLQNVLSISTAGKNRYLLHFNSLHSLTQWTAGIRLAMFELASLQELYTGSLIAGKGKTLNNIKSIMDRSRLKTEDWARVRFGAGTPWRRCWCVISPPDEKDFQKHQKQAKKKSAYDRRLPSLKGDIKFYDSKKTKKASPIATITDAFSAYAIYPQSKPLIDQSTLVKVEGMITIHTRPESTTEGFVFVMPEVHPAVSGFEMMLRWLFPVFDTFALYGRPTKLIADTLDVRGLMFAMPRERRYDYLEILDVSSLIHTEGSHRWREADWRRKMKELTAKRIQTLASRESIHGSRAGSRRGVRTSLPSRPGGIRFDDRASVMSTPSARDSYPTPPSEVPGSAPPRQTATAPPAHGPFKAPRHARSVSESVPQGRYQQESRDGYATPPAPPPHRSELRALEEATRVNHSSDSNDASLGRSSSDSDFRPQQPLELPVRGYEEPSSVDPVAAPPAFAHRPGSKPSNKPYHSPELRRANSRMSTETLSQLAGAGAGAVAASHRDYVGRTPAEEAQRGLQMDADGRGAPIDYSAYHASSNNYQGSNLTDRPLPPPPSELAQDYDPPQYYGAPVPPPHQRRESPSRDSPPQSRTSFEGSQSAQNRGQFQPSELPGAPMNRDVAGYQDGQNRYQPSPLRQAQQQEQPLGNNRGQGGAFPNFNPPTQGQPRRSHENEYSVSGNAPSAQYNDAAQRPALQSSYSVARKPLPDRTLSNVSNVESSHTNSSLGSLQNHVFDQEALDMITANNGGAYAAHNDQSVHRQPSNISSNYDNDSVESPDYASTRRSTETRRSVERPRTGVMRTVGNVQSVPKEVPVGDTYFKPDSKPQALSSDIPDIDFGPTLNYASTASNKTPAADRPSPSPSHNKSRSSELMKTPSPNAGPRGGTPSPADDRKRYSYGLGGGYSSEEQSRPHSRSPSRALTPIDFESPTPDSAGSENIDHRRSVLWQPGLAAGAVSGSDARRSLTPEQFVQQRSQQSRATPVYAHQRKPSRDALRSGTPPLTNYYSADSSPTLHGRSSSGEQLSRPHSRGASTILPPTAGEQPARPHSRGASTTLSPSADYSARLSAREQEHVARVTGSPLLNMPGGGANSNSRQRHSMTGGGLIGAIEAREREKKEIKEGLSGQMVQQAIMQRQQQSHGSPHGQQQFQTSPGYAGSRPASYFGPQTTYQQQQQPQSQQWGQARMPGGWTSPGMESPFQYAQQQQQQYPNHPYSGSPQQGQGGGYQGGSYGY